MTGFASYTHSHARTRAAAQRQYVCNCDETAVMKQYVYVCACLCVSAAKCTKSKTCFIEIGTFRSAKRVGVCNGVRCFDVQVSRANFIHSWVQVPQAQTQRLSEGLWQLKAMDLEREADYHVLPSDLDAF